MSLCMIGAARAQDLAAFLAAADRESLQLREAGALADARQREYQQARAALYPRLSAQGTYTRNQFAAEAVLPTAPGVPPESIVIVPQNQWDAELRVAAPLVDVPQWLRLGAVGASADAARAQRDTVRDDVRRFVAASYFDLQAAREQAEASRRAIQASEELVRYTQARIEGGTASDIDAARARAELAERQQAHANALRAAAIAERRLQTQTGLVPGELAPPAGLLLRADAPVAQWEQRIPLLPEVVAAAARADAARAQARAARLAWAPTLSAAAAQRFTNATSFADENAYYVASLVATVQLDMISVRGAQARQAEAEAAQAQLELARRRARDRLHEDHRSVLALAAAAAAAQARLEATRQTAELLQQRFAAGSATSFEVVQARRDAFLAEASLAAARASLAAANVSLRLSAALPPLPGEGP